MTQKYVLPLLAQARGVRFTENLQLEFNLAVITSASISNPQYRSTVPSLDDVELAA